MRGRGGVVFLTIALCASLMAAIVELATADEIPVLDESGRSLEPRIVLQSSRTRGAEPKKVVQAESRKPIPSLVVVA